jgi:hypothetical protein
MTSNCASSPRTFKAAPRLDMPTEALRPCTLVRLPERATQADLDIAYASRGAELVACDAARRLAVQTHEAEHQLEERLTDPKTPRKVGFKW